MVMSRDPGFKFGNFYFLPNSVLNFRKVTKLGKLAQEQKVIGKLGEGGLVEKTPQCL